MLIFRHTILALLFIIPSYSACAESEVLVGKLTLPKENLFDAKAKRDLATIAQRIKKARKTGTVRVVAVVPSADSHENFNSRSFIIGRNAESQLRPLIPKTFQIFVTSAKYTQDIKPDKYEISFYLYPFELMQEGAKFVSTDLEQVDIPKAQDSAATPSQNTSEPAVTTTSGAEIRHEIYDDSRSRRGQSVEETENASAAEELVNKAKARAAKRAKELEAQ